MNNYRYSLEQYTGMKSKHFCPNCKKKTLTRYIDKKNMQQIANHVGRCSREEKCQYHYTPKMYFEENGILKNDFYSPNIQSLPKPIKCSPSTINHKVLKRTLGKYDNNNFALGLYKLFDKNDVNRILKKYLVGTAKNQKTIFWQVNTKYEIRTGKIISFNIDTLKRTKNISWIHALLKIPNFNLKQIFFGAHLLNDKSKTVAITEGEKNAILGALFYPQYNWIAVGGIQMLNVTKLNYLKNYKVILFPDKGLAFNKWTEIANQANFKLSVSNIIERTELPEGSDIADLVIAIKNKGYQNPLKITLNKFIEKNKQLENLISKFNLVIKEN